MDGVPQYCIRQSTYLYINKAVMHASLHTGRLFALFDETKQNISQERPLIEALYMSGCSKTPLACSNGWVRPRRAAERVGSLVAFDGISKETWEKSWKSLAKKREIATQLWKKRVSERSSREISSIYNMMPRWNFHQRNIWRLLSSIANGQALADRFS